MGVCRLAFRSNNTIDYVKPRFIASVCLLCSSFHQIPKTGCDIPRTLVSRQCAYWVSLRGAPESANEREQTVYVPRSQPLSPEGLRALMTRISRREVITYGS